MKGLLLILALITLTGCPTEEELAGGGESKSECHKDNGSLSNFVSNHTNHHYYHELNLSDLATREGLPCHVAVYTTENRYSRVSGYSHYITIPITRLEDSDLDIKLYLRDVVRDYRNAVTRI